MADFDKDGIVSLDGIFAGLKSLGYSPIIKPLKFVTVEVDENVYVIMLDSQDSNFVQILLPSIFDSDQIKEFGINAVYEACNAANKQCKLARAFVLDDYVSCSLDCLSDNVGEFVVKFKRYISALQYCRSTFARDLVRRVKK